MTLSKYILKEHLKPFIVTIFFLTSILVIDQISRLLDLIIGKGLDLQSVMKLFLLTLPMIVSQTIPMSVLVAVLITFGRFSQDGEIIAMKACGVSINQLIRPLLIAASFIFIAMIYFNSFIMPFTNHKLVVLYRAMSKIKPTAILEAGIMNNEIKGFSIYIEKIESTTSELQNVYILDKREPNPLLMLGERGYLYYNIARDVISFELYDGEIHKYEKHNDKNFQKIKFKKHIFSFSLKSNDLKEKETNKGDREMNVFELDNEINRLKGKVNDLESKISDLNADSEFNKNKLKTFESDLNYHRKKLNSSKVEFHKKFVIPFACIIFIFLGVSLGVVTKRGGKVGLGLSVFVFMFYYVCLLGGEAIAERKFIEPFIAMWAPNVIMSIIAFFLMWFNKKEGNFALFERILYFWRKINEKIRSVFIK